MKNVKLLFLLIGFIMIFGCTETPNEIPIDSLRDVVFNADMNDYIDDGLFNADVDILRLKGEFNNWGNDLIMVESRDEGVYTIELLDLIMGKTYEYRYCINDSLEALDGSNREYQVQNENNNVTNYYNELDPTIVIFKVNMNVQIDNGNFNPLEDTVDVPGTHNDWSEANPMTDEDDDGIYETSVSTLAEGDYIEYKFRINFDWDNAEFDGGGNRNHTVEEGIHELLHWYNDEEG